VQQFQAALEVGTLIRQDRLRNAASLSHRRILLAHNFSIRHFDRQQFQHLQVRMHERTSELHPLRALDAEDQQHLDRADLNRVIDDPNPVVREFFGTLQLVQPDSQNPVLNRGVRCRFEWQAASQRDDEIETSLTGTQTGCGLEYEADGRENDIDREATSPQAMLGLGDDQVV
jgi:hypothetical protein